MHGMVDKAPNAVGAKGRFWTTVESTREDLSRAVGCYVFCIGKKPYYVGLAEKQGFRRECFQPTKINAYNYAMKKKGKPYLVLVAKLTGTEKFAKPGKNGHKSIQ